MSAPYSDVLELEDFLLPPIPGPLPHPEAFCRNVPLHAPAVFSTVAGMKPFRPLPSPPPLPIIRPVDPDDIKRKAWSLIHMYPDVTQPVIYPPRSWPDLFIYFDPLDVWTEGAGFLFHVVGFIVKINVTRLKCIEEYAGDWARRNEAKLTNMHPNHDVLYSGLTLHDQMYFDIGNMTRHETNTLVTILNNHRQAVQAKHGSLQVARSPRHPRTMPEGDSYHQFSQQGTCHCEHWEALSSFLHGVMIC